MAEHRLEQARVAVHGHALVGVLEVAVVPGDEHGHPRRHRRVHFLGGEAPLLLGVVEEHVLVHEVGHFRQFRILLGPQLVDGHLPLVAEGGDELLNEAGGLLGAEGDLHGVLVEGHGHVGAEPIGEHLVLVTRPFREAGQVIVGLLAVGVEDVRPIAVHEDAGLVILVVGVAGDVIALLDDEHAQPPLLGQLAGGHGTGESGADDHRVKVGDVDGAKIGVGHCHGGNSSLWIGG